MTDGGLSRCTSTRQEGGSRLSDVVAQPASKHGSSKAARYRLALYLDRHPTAALMSTSHSAHLSRSGGRKQ